MFCPFELNLLRCFEVLTSVCDNWEVEHLNSGLFVPVVYVYNHWPDDRTARSTQPFPGRSTKLPLQAHAHVHVFTKILNRKFMKWKLLFSPFRVCEGVWENQCCLTAQLILCQSCFLKMSHLQNEFMDTKFLLSTIFITVSLTNCVL